MSQDTVKATDNRVRKGRWIYLDTHPRGWFLITYRNPMLDTDGKIHIAVNNRGPAYDVRLPPSADVMIRSYTVAG